ncbi:DUF1178 family protein [Arenibaculum sp.]|jgi:hypothetical protein|uniref:DUF1178 family protein n=1 Tax=Arenibaculum sp. TaxID=2865862 RepID=UPI002E1620D3|nr:DUF1178 family protein [Arenibaculum sp.]
MILFELQCAKGHGFEAWFRNGEAYEAQAAAGEVACPACGDADVRKAPMAPRIAKARSGKDEEKRRQAAEIMRELVDLRRKVEENCDYVGDSFAEEARKIHYGETERRDIYGEATAEEAAQLSEEGVTFSRIPWVPRTNS